MNKRVIISGSIYYLVFIQSCLHVDGCNLFIDDKCPFNDKACWFLHEDVIEGQDDHDSEVENVAEGNNTKQSVFQDVLENLDPPIKDLH